MNDATRAYIQHVLPQKALTALAGLLANANTPWLKNWIIGRFVRQYQIDMQDAVVQDPFAYANFNEFFTRKLSSAARPIATGNAIISPADGVIAEIGQIAKQQLLQAKNAYYNLESLFAGNKQLAELFTDGSFATIYLAPHNYHRVHMPIDGELKQTIYVPGKLFSVNRLTTDHIPNLYARNERFITLFDTAIGNMAVIFVGAMIVAGIQPSWQQHPVRSRKITYTNLTPPLTFEKGAELGYFNLGSTVILLFQHHQTQWRPELTTGTKLNFGEVIAI